ncbi:MAG TPA: hypothetical protein VH062_19430 [Polyangiaceae bacterium]|nr:hypothetical protein [Polyangiaceae bacterium]
MSPAQLRDDVIRRLEDARQHVMNSMHDVDDIDANGNAMLALKEIRGVLDDLHDELDRLEEEQEASKEPIPTSARGDKAVDSDATYAAPDDLEPSVGDVVEAPDIRGMVSALASKARPR